MRVRIDEANDGTSQEGGNTRAKRARAHAIARIKARHVERDYFGRPIPDPNDAGATVGATKAAAEKGATRLDAWLVANGHAVSRDRAKDLIASGAVSVSNVTKLKASTLVFPHSVVTVDGSTGGIADAVAGGGASADDLGL